MLAPFEARSGRGIVLTQTHRPDPLGAIQAVVTASEGVCPERGYQRYGRYCPSLQPAGTARTADTAPYGTRAIRCNCKTSLRDHATSGSICPVVSCSTVGSGHQVNNFPEFYGRAPDEVAPLFQVAYHLYSRSPPPPAIEFENEMAEALPVGPVDTDLLCLSSVPP